MLKLLILVSCLLCWAAGSGLGLGQKLQWLNSIRPGMGGGLGWGPGQSSLTINDVSASERQRFLLDVLLQVHRPLVNARLIEMGSILIDDPYMYTQPNDELLLDFLEQVRNHEILGRTDIYNGRDIQQVRQLIGLQRFLVLARDWITFQRNVCFARLHINPIMFVNALSLAVRDRADTQGLILPALNEILPQLYYDNEILLSAQNANWNDLGIIPHHVRPTLWNILGLHARGMNRPVPLEYSERLGLWRPWQNLRMRLGGVPVVSNGRNVNMEVKMVNEPQSRIVFPVTEDCTLSSDVSLNILWNNIIMDQLVQPLNENKQNPYRVENELLRQRIGGLQDDKRMQDSFGNIRREQDGILNEKQEGIELPTEDVNNERLAYVGRRRMSQTRNLNDRQEIDQEVNRQNAASIEQGVESQKRNRVMDIVDTDQRRIVQLHKTLTSQELKGMRRGEILLQSLQQLAARLRMEAIALKLDTKEQNNQWRGTIGQQQQQLISDVLQQLRIVIERTLEIEQIPRNSALVMNVIADILLGVNVQNVVDQRAYATLQKQLQRLTVEGNDPTNEITFLSVLEGNLRDPLTRQVIMQLVQLIHNYRQELRPRTLEDLIERDLKLTSVEIDRLITYNEPIDVDLINLNDQQLLQSRENNLQFLQQKVVAREQRLNHQPFTITYKIKAQREQEVVVRTMIGPQIDENGRPIPFAQNRQNFVMLDAFVQRLIVGDNVLVRRSSDISGVAPDVSTLNHIYRTVIMGKTMDQLAGTSCLLPQRLVLPRGAEAGGGLPVQVLVVVTPLTDEDRELQKSIVNIQHICGIGVNSVNLDWRPLDFPLDRNVVDIERMILPNVLLQRDRIEHLNQVSQ